VTSIQRNIFKPYKISTAKQSCLGFYKRRSGKALLLVYRK